MGSGPEPRVRIYPLARKGRQHTNFGLGVGAAYPSESAQRKKMSKCVEYGILRLGVVDCQDQSGQTAGGDCCTYQNMPTPQLRKDEEHEPLLANGSGGESTYGTSSTLTPNGNGSHSPKATDGDVEGDTAAVQENPEVQRARRNITMMLPALAVGVSFEEAHHYYPCTIEREREPLTSLHIPRCSLQQWTHRSSTPIMSRSLRTSRVWSWRPGSRLRELLSLW